MTTLSRLAGCLFLAGLGIAWPAQAQGPADEPRASLNPLSALDLESLAATRTLPLFTPTRSPPVVEQAIVPEAVVVEPEIMAAPEPVPPVLRLVGPVMTEAEQVALLAEPATGMVHRLRPGESYDGWTLEIIDGRTVAFSNEGREHVLTMFEQFDGSSAPQPIGDPLVVPEPEL